MGALLLSVGRVASMALYMSCRQSVVVLAWFLKILVFADYGIWDTQDPMTNFLSLTLTMGRHDDIRNKCLHHQ